TPTAVPKCDAKQTDVILVLDACCFTDASFADNFVKLLDFAGNYTEQFDLGPDDVQFGAVVFGNSPLRVFDLKDFSNHTKMTQAIGEAPALRGTLRTNKAFDLVASDMFSVAKGGRENASKIVILMTDSPSADLAD
ncbi:von Willebrand factor A domain-containing protein 2-like, partial [Aplysia californica]|uniref:von Willebrand factor A domain-containing protein 2-like n=1 Tax=Aplysia californica TaxID=6500 RepID=A0ABM0KBG3_APLCA